MIDDPLDKPNQAPPPPEPTTPERLFEFVVGHDRYVFELLDHGEHYGVECRIFVNEQLVARRRFDPRLDASRPPRELAIAWAHEERTSIRTST